MAAIDFIIDFFAGVANTGTSFPALTPVAASAVGRAVPGCPPAAASGRAALAQWRRRPGKSC